MRAFPAQEDWQLYERAAGYYEDMGLYRTVSLNESFYAGDQWRDEYGGKIETNGLPAPVFNLFKRVINYQIAAVLSQKVSLSYIMRQTGEKAEADREACDRLNSYIADKWARMDMDGMLNDALLDAALSGNGVFFTYWDSSRKNGDPYCGDFVTRLVDNVDLLLADPANTRLEDQSWIMLSGRAPVRALRDEGIRNGLTERELLLICADEPTGREAGRIAEPESAEEKCTFLMKLWKDRESGHVYCRKSVKAVYLTPEPVDTGLTLYPVAQFAWDRRKGSWIGQAPATGLIPNQRYINQSFAMVMYHMMMTAFSKVVYNADKVEGGWDNSVGSAIPVAGDVENVAKIIEGGAMQPGMLDTIDKAMGYTKELMGTTDAALGNVNPTNTSAILALQKASALPLEGIRRNLYRCVERLGMIWLEFMLANYPEDRVICYEKNGKQCAAPFEGRRFYQELTACRAEAGSSDYYSAAAAAAVLDRLLENGNLTFAQYLERLPDGILPKRQELLREIMQQDAEGKGERKEDE